MSDPTPPLRTAERVELQYATPVGKARRTSLLIGLAASVFYAFGAGMIAFGMSLHAGDRDAPPFIAIGVSAIVLVTGCLISVQMARR